MQRKTLGVKRSKDNPLTRKAGFLRQSGPSSFVRHPEPPLNYSIRSLESSQAGHSLTANSCTGPASMWRGGVGATQSASFDNQNHTIITSNCEDTKRNIYLFKELALYLAKSALHVDILDVHMRSETVPNGIFRPTYNTLIYRHSPFRKTEQLNEIQLHEK